MNVFKKSWIGLSILSVLVFSSCAKEYEEFNNMEVVENTFMGNIEITSGGSDPAGDFTGTDASGTYSFAWENSERKADARFDITTTGSGKVQMIIKDAKGDKVLDESRGGSDNDTFSDVSSKGRKGTWLVTLVFTEISGDGSFSINPEN